MTAIIHPPEAAGVTPRPRQEVIISTDPRSEVWQAGAAVVAQVFKDSGYIDSKAELDKEYESYLPYSEMATLFRNGKAIGGTLMTRYNEATGFKTEHDMAEGRLQMSDQGCAIMARLDRHRTLEIGTIGTETAYRGIRGAAVVSELYKTIFTRSHELGATDLLASFDADYFHGKNGTGGFERRFHPAVTALGPPVMYMGSLTVPAHVNLAEIRPEMLEPRRNVVKPRPYEPPVEPIRL